jgi:hypothetical protein
VADDLTEYALAGYNDKPNENLYSSPAWYAHALGRAMRSAYKPPEAVRMGRGESVWASGMLFKYTGNAKRGEWVRKNPEKFDRRGGSKSAADYLKELREKFPQVYEQLVDPRSAPYRKVNPSQQAQVDAAAERFAAFTGEPASELQRMNVPEKKVFLVVGELLAVAYGTVRAGQYDEWHHEFRKRSRPLLAVSHDGRSLSIVGGRFEFTDAGIEDR